jgi:hypothetical protein
VHGEESRALAIRPSLEFRRAAEKESVEQRAAVQSIGFAPIPSRDCGFEVQRVTAHERCELNLVSMTRERRVAEYFAQTVERFAELMAGA